MTVTIRPFNGSEADYEAVAAIRNECYPEYPITAAELRTWDEKRDEKLAFRRFLAEADGAPVGEAVYENVSWMYHPRKFFVGLSVAPEHQGRGVGAALYDHLLAELEPSQPIALRHTLREDYERSVAFAARRGFVEEMRAWESRLDVTTFDAARFAGAEERALAEGIRIATAKELLASDGDEFWRKMYELDMIASRDVPMPEPFTPPPYESWLRTLLNNPAMIEEGFFIALDGERYVGLSSLWRRQATPILDTGFTATHPDYRRRGIALALKLRAVDYARRTGAPMIRTDNASTNRPMLSINEALGFVRQPAWVTMVRKFRDE